MDKKVFKKLAAIRYDGVRDWTPISVRLHPDLLSEIDLMAQSQHLSRNEFMFNSLRFFIMGLLSGGELQKTGFGEVMLESLVDSMSKQLGLPRELLLEKIKSGITNGSSDIG